MPARAADAYTQVYEFSVVLLGWDGEGSNVAAKLASPAVR